MKKNSIILITILIIMAIVSMFVFVGTYLINLKENNDPNEENELVKNNEIMQNEIEEDNKISQDNELLENKIVEQNKIIEQNEIKNTTTNKEENLNEELNEEIIGEPVIEKEYIEGIEVSGYLEFPKFNSKIAVFPNVTAKSLNIASAIAYGPGLNEVGNTVIFGNIGVAFKDVPVLVIGDKIKVTDDKKNIIEYEVYDIQTVSSNDATYMIRDTGGRREIVLQTGGATADTRLIVIAREINKK